MATSMIMQALAPKPSGRGGDQTLANQDRQANVKQPITHWQQIYGQARVGGAITFLHSTNNNQTLHMVLTIAGHSVDEIGSIYLDDVLVPLDSSGNALAQTDPDPSIKNWSGHCQVFKGLGTTAGDTALWNALKANCPDKWTDDHKQAGRAKIYIVFQYSSNLFSGSMPKVTAVVRGKKVYDPRAANTTIVSSATGTPGVFTTATAHGLSAGDDVYIGNHTAIGGRDGAPIDGNYIVNTVPSPTTFTLIDCSFPVAVTQAGTPSTKPNRSAPSIPRA